MTKQEMIEAIYKKIADKELSFWCRVSFWANWMWCYPANHYYWIITTEKYTIEKTKTIYYVIGRWFQRYNCFWKSNQKPQEWEIFQNEEGKIVGAGIYNNVNIIWQPVMIWDVLDYLEKDFYKNTEIFTVIWKHNFILQKWKNKRKSIDEQSEDCIEYIYNLIK